MKQQIIQGTEDLVFQYGIKSITMDDIAKHFGISKKTIYTFFVDKNEIVHALMQKKIREHEKEFKAIEKQSSNVIEEFFLIMEHVGDMFRKINPKTFYDLQKYHAKTWMLFTKFKEEFVFRMIESTLKRGIKQGLIRPKINIEILVRMRMQQIDMGMNPSVFPSEKFALVDVHLSILEHFLYGICTLKGHALINKYNQLSEEL